MVREIVFDTETTGLSYPDGDRLIEIGAFELVNHLPTGKTYHQFINPERDVPEAAVAIHGLTESFLKDYPVFAEVAQDFIDFVGEDGILVAHNAKFDMGFINFELKKAGFEEYSYDRVIDTLAIAKKMLPGVKHDLNSLCRRYGVDNSKRDLHGALIDADLLAQVYFELLGGAEPSMLADEKREKTSFSSVGMEKSSFHKPRSFPLSEDEEKAHREFLEKKVKSAIWLADESDSTN